MNQKNFKRVMHREKLTGKFLLFRSISTKYLKNVGPKYRLERGRRMLCFVNDEIGIELFTKGVYERLQLEALNRILNLLHIDTYNLAFLDVGANIGNHTLRLSPLFAKTLAYEPNPNAHYALKFNTSGLANLDCYQYGLGSSDTETILYQCESNLGATSYKQSNPDETPIKVAIRKLYNVYNSSLSIGLIKLDVEGMEYEALLGASELIARDRPLIVFEKNIDSDDESRSSVGLL